MIDFIGLGAQKSGTSWAYACLYEHPQICAPIKEIHFFSRPRFEKGREWYENHFTKCKEGKIQGEFSTSYLYSKEASERIYALYPDARLIAILRNPAERAYSHYRNAIKAGEIQDTVPFEEFVQLESSVLEQGLYTQQLQRYFAHFRKEQMLVLIYEDIEKDPKAFMRGIYRFLGVDETFISSMLYTEVNIARTPKDVRVDRVMHRIAEFLRKTGFDKLVHAIRKTGLPDFVRKGNTKKVTSHFNAAKIAPYFVADVQKLSVLLDRDLSTEWNIT